MVRVRAMHHAQQTGTSSQKTLTTYLVRKMSSLARHHRLRMMTGLTWRGEYLLAILQEEGECKTQYLRHIGMSYDIIEVLNTLEERGYIKIRKPSHKLRLHSLTDLGREYLEQVAKIYMTPQEQQKEEREQRERNREQND